MVCIKANSVFLEIQFQQDFPSQIPFGINLFQ